MAENGIFQDLRIVDNFYQTSSFFPMPVVLMGTLAKSGQTNLGPYSLCFPYYIAGKGYYAMVLETRNSSNTAQNILRTGRATINFIPDKKTYMKWAVTLGYPGDTTEEKMKNCRFTLMDGLSQKDNPGEPYPKIVAESFQVYECTWMKDLEDAERDRPQESYPGPYRWFNGITSEYGAHFILRIDRILMKPVCRSALINGNKARLFPRVPIDYGYRDNENFWFARFRRPYVEKIPKNKGLEVSAVWYAANRIDPGVTFTEDACAKLVKVPRVFLNAALKGCVEWAKENGVTTVTAAEMDLIRDKRAKEKR